MNYGAPGEIRTPDRLVRSQVLYPAELRAHERVGIIHKDGGEGGIDSGPSLDPRPAGAGRAGVPIGCPADWSNQRVLINTSRTTNKYGPNRGHIYLAVVRVYYEIVSGIFPDIGKNTGNFPNSSRIASRIHRQVPII